MSSHNKALQTDAAKPRRRAAERSVRVKNKIIPTMALALFSASVYPVTFEERVEKANAVFETEDGESYEKKLGPFIQQAIRKCAPAGSTSKKNWGKFVLVVDVSPGGEMINPIVKPETEISVCFSEKFVSQTLPTPPDSIVSDGFVPLVVEVYVVQ